MQSDQIGALTLVLLFVPVSLLEFIIKRQLFWHRVESDQLTICKLRTR